MTRENNQAAGKTWVWTYDNVGNITSRKEYTYTTGALGTMQDAIACAFDTAGNPLTADERQFLNTLFIIIIALRS